jgi:predicted ATPase/DNA-binding CsgD family transcriptional regulator
VLDLPAQPGPLIGRAAELSAIRERLVRGDVRMLTLIGAAGTGKTRLAVAAARELVDEFDGGMHFVDLSPLSDASLVPSAIAQALDVREEPDVPLLEGLTKHLARRGRVLLLLDNFEQLLPAAPRLSTLLEACPELVLLVTSRSALHLRWEHEFSVSPLEVPSLSPLPPLASLAQVASVALFIQRTKRVEGRFELDDTSAPAVAEICARLDGLPLAIELAAARTRALTPQALLRRLEHRLNVLEGGAVDQPQRQRTLRGAVTWSYDLLSPDEQMLFRRLGVFVGGFGLDAIPEVCDPDGALGIDPLDGIESLIDKSLLRQQRDNAATDAEPRFGMLETIREYAIERLVESGEQPDTHRRHAYYYLAGADVALAQIKHTQQGVWLRSLEADHGNLRAALTWCVEHNAAELGLNATGLLGWFWTTRGYISEGRARLQALLALPTKTAPHLRAEALRVAGMLALSQSDYTAARALFEESLSIRRQSTDQAGLVGPLSGLGAATMQLGLHAIAKASFEEALAIQTTMDDKVGMSESFNSLANLAHNRGDLATARALYEMSQELNREVGYRVDVVLHNLGVLAEEEGDLATARLRFEESVAIKRAVSDSNGLALSLAKLGQVMAASGDLEAAHRLLSESLAIKHELGDRPGMAYALERFALVAAGHGRPERALRLAGAAAALRESVGSPLDATANAALEAHLDGARRVLRAQAADGAWLQGARMSLEEAVEYACSADALAAPSGLATTRAHQAPGQLTAREREVSALVARGLTNRQIAAELVLSERTVDVHVSNILSKLQLTSRAQLAAWVATRGTSGSPT